MVNSDNHQGHERIYQYKIITGSLDETKSTQINVLQLTNFNV